MTVIKHKRELLLSIIFSLFISGFVIAQGTAEAYFKQGNNYHHRQRKYDLAIAAYT